MKTNELTINKLFLWMRRNYGSFWVMRFNNKGLYISGKAEWLVELKKFNSSHVTKTLKIVKNIYPDDPPTMKQFSELVSNQKNYKPGHGSNKLFKTESGIADNKVNKSIAKVYLNKIRESVS